MQIISRFDFGIKLTSFNDTKSGILSKKPTSFAASIALSNALPIITTDLLVFAAISNKDLIRLIFDEKHVVRTIFFLFLISLNKPL